MCNNNDIYIAAVTGAYKTPRFAVFLRIQDPIPSEIASAASVALQIVEDELAPRRCHVTFCAEDESRLETQSRRSSPLHFTRSAVGQEERTCNIGHRFTVTVSTVH